MSKNETPQEAPTAEIPTEREMELRAKLAQLNKKATKLGTPEITIRVGDAFDKNTETGIYSYIPVWVDGEAPKLNGWVFVATLEHDENGTIIRRIPTFQEEIDLTQYRTATPDNCDQCHARRRRNDTYIVARLRLGSTLGFETKQVGSSCLKDFTGHENPQAVARFMEEVRDFIENLGGGSYDGGHLTPRYSLTFVLQVGAHVVANGGYVSRRKADETGETPTGYVVRSEVYTRLRERSQTPLDGNVDTTAVIEWVRALTDRDLESDYLYNLYTVCKGDTITDRQFGIAVSAIPAYQLAQQRLAERSSSERVDEFVGQPKDKIDIEFKVLRVFENPTEYGMNYKNIMRATDGHAFTWSTGNPILEAGKSYSATFTIKGHYEGKNGKETQVFRPNLKTLKEMYGDDK